MSFARTQARALKREGSAPNDKRMNWSDCNRSILCTPLSPSAPLFPRWNTLAREATTIDTNNTHTLTTEKYSRVEHPIEVNVLCWFWLYVCVRVERYRAKVR